MDPKHIVATRVRRKIRLAGLMTLLVGLGLPLWAFVLEPASLSVRQVDLEVPHLEGNRLSVAVLTDLHVGSPFHSIRKLEEIVRRTNRTAPDVIVILGDLVIHGVIGGRFVEPEPIAAVLGGLEAPGGVFAVLGNHDHWLDAPRITEALESAGITVLFDTAAPVLPLDLPDDVAGTRPREGPWLDQPSVWIGGVSDFWEGPHDVEATLSGTPPESPVILITHNPDVFPTVPSRVSLTIAGHTHGGQVRFPFIGAPVVPSDFGQRFVEGHVVEGDRHLFVSAGTGTSMLPVRFRVPPRVTLLNLSGAH